MCSWKQHFNDNLEALRSTAFQLRENPERLQNKSPELQAASEITSLPASLFPWVTLYSWCWRNIKEAQWERMKEGCIHHSISESKIYFPPSVGRCLCEWHPSEQTHTYLSAVIATHIEMMICLVICAGNCFPGHVFPLSRLSAQVHNGDLILFIYLFQILLCRCSRLSFWMDLISRTTQCVPNWQQLTVW